MGFQILDATIIAKEGMDSIKKGMEVGMLCKLDIEEAYGHFNWEFQWLAMRRT